MATPPTGIARPFPRHPASVGAARRAVDELGARLQPALLADLRLLVSELVSNSVEHSPRHEGSSIRLTVWISSDRVRAEVVDGGRGFVAEAFRPPADSPGGRGLYMVDQVAARWGVSGEDGTRVWFELDRELSDAARQGGELASGMSGVSTAA